MLVHLVHFEKMSQTHSLVAQPSWDCILRECLKIISKMTTSQAKQFETVSDLISIHICKELTDHLNFPHKKNMHESFEMALYWSYLEMNKNDNLRQKA
jgi:hypothetical protein